jgi:hypothetical protein
LGLVARPLGVAGRCSPAAARRPTTAVEARGQGQPVGLSRSNAAELSDLWSRQAGGGAERLRRSAGVSAFPGRGECGRRSSRGKVVRPRCATPCPGPRRRPDQLLLGGGPGKVSLSRSGCSWTSPGDRR